MKVYVKLMRATDSVTARLHRHLKDERLTASQFGVLEALYHLGPMCQQELGRKILKTGGNMTMVIDNLEKRGLVVRKRDTDDRRYFQVALTPGGKRLTAEVFRRHARIAQDIFSVLEPPEIEQLGRLLKKLGRRNMEIREHTPGNVNPPGLKKMGLGARGHEALPSDSSSLAAVSGL